MRTDIAIPWISVMTPYATPPADPSGGGKQSPDASAVAAPRAHGAVGPAFDRPGALPQFALHLQAVVHAHPDLATAADAVAHEIAQAFDAERVSIALRDRGASRLLAGSAEAERLEGAAQARALEHAMDEAIDQAAVIRWPPESGDLPRITALHAQYSRLTHSRLTTIPLVDDQRAIGAITFEHPRAAVLPESMRHASDLLAPLGPLLALRQIAEAGGLARWRLRSARQAPDHRRRRRLAWTIAVLCALGAMIPVADRVGAPARVEGEVQRTLVSPVDGYIGAVHARPGDRVRRGQVLAELARGDLDLERDRWAATLAQHENAYRNALARGERPQYAAAVARASEALAELERVQAQIARSQLTAPFDGLLISGDLTQSLGTPVRRGEVLLTVSPWGRHRIIAEIDEHDVERVREGTSGIVVLAALPDRRIDVTVKRIFPAAVSRDGRTFYEAETQPASEFDALRPGLLGQVRFEGKRSPLALALGRRLLDWMRLQLWSAGAWLS